MGTRRLLREVTIGDWVIQGMIPSMVLGWGLWIMSWFGFWLGLCGLLYFVLANVVYPVQARTHAESGRLLPGVGFLCGLGFFVGMAWMLIVGDGASDAVVLGALLGLCAIPLGVAAGAFLWTPMACRFGLALPSPVVDVDPNEWPDPPPNAGTSM